jgi:hypothetical protein
LQVVDRLAGGGDLLAEFVVTGPILLPLAFGGFQPLVELADLALCVGKLVGGLLARGARLGLNRIELPAGGGKLLDEFLVLRAALFELLAERGDLLVATRDGLAFDVCRSRFELFGELADAKPQLERRRR